MDKKFTTRQLDMAERIVASVMHRTKVASVFDYERKARVVRKINKDISEIARGFFTDDYWQPVNKIWKYFKVMDTRADLESAEYGHDEKGNPNSKTWKFKVYFINEQGKETMLHGYIVASFCGTVEDNMSRYDLVAYVG